MAIFASTTTSGYSDPLKAMSIKALEQRQKDMLAQQAAQQPDPAIMGTIPGGIGHVLTQVGNNMKQARADQAIAAQKQELARIMAGINPETGLTPEQASRLAVIAPDMYKDVIQQFAERRRQQDLFGQQDKARAEQARLDEIARQQGYTHANAAAAQKVLDEQAAAAEKARVAEITRGQEDTAIRARDAQKRLDDEVAAAAQENRLQSRPTDLDVVKADRALARGEIDQATRDAIVNKATGPSAAEMKAGNELQITHLDTQSAISDLKEARTLLGPEGTGIRAGAGAGFGQTGAKWGGDYLGLTSDPALTQRTERYNQLMSAEAITAMAAKLKGASTDYEMKAFVALMNDPNAEPKTKMQALDKMIAKAEAQQALQLDQMKRARVPTPGGGGAATVDPLEGRTANGPNGPLIRRNGKWVPNG